MRPKRRRVDQHPLWAQRFDESDWSGSWPERVSTWKRQTKTYWDQRVLLGDSELPTVSCDGGEPSHLLWRLSLLSEARRLLRGD